MSFLPQIDKIYFPSVIGMPKKDLDRLVEHLDGYYREWSKEKLDKETGLSKKDKNGNIKSRIVRESKGIIKDIQGRISNRILKHIILLMRDIIKEIGIFLLLFWKTFFPQL